MTEQSMLDALRAEHPWLDHAFEIHAAELERLRAELAEARSGEAFLERARAFEAMRQRAEAAECIIASQAAQIAALRKNISDLLDSFVSNESELSMPAAVAANALLDDESFSQVGAPATELTKMAAQIAAKDEALQIAAGIGAELERMIGRQAENKWGSQPRDQFEAYVDHVVEATGAALGLSPRAQALVKVMEVLGAWRIVMKRKRANGLIPSTEAFNLMQAYDALDAKGLS
jgi:hypothetical protein